MKYDKSTVEDGKKRRVDVESSTAGMKTNKARRHNWKLTHLPEAVDEVPNLTYKYNPSITLERHWSIRKTLKINEIKYIKISYIKKQIG